MSSTSNNPGEDPGEKRGIETMSASSKENSKKKNSSLSGKLKLC